MLGRAPDCRIGHPVWLSLAFALVLIGGGRAWAADDTASEREALYTAYAAQLENLAAACQRDELPDAASQLRGWLPPRESDRLTLFPLPFHDDASRESDAERPEWRAQWRSLRVAQAEALVALARKALAEHQSTTAYELLVEALREDPDHALARRVLGYVRYRDAWQTPFAAKQLGAGKVWHDRFGWLPKSHVERYERGERNYLGRWMTEKEEAAMRSDINPGWRVETDHYVVTTNHSLEEGVALARRLEMLHGIWRQVFVDYLFTEAELARRFEGRVQRRDTKQHNVVYYRTRDEYNAALRSRQPRIDITLGIYFDTDRTAYFFAGESQQVGTLYHEATHQLFHESRQVAADVGQRGNFWIVEGIACYMETLATQDGYCTLGGHDAGRMPAARHRLLVDGFYVPLSQLVTLGVEDLQQATEIAKIYSQCAAQAAFLMHDQNGRYREALMQYLEAIYTGRATASSLAAATGEPYEVLDRQYRQFMSEGAPRDAVAQ